MGAVMKLQKGVNMAEITNINGLWKSHIETSCFKTFLKYVCVENYMQIK